MLILNQFLAIYRKIEHFAKSCRCYLVVLSPFWMCLVMEELIDAATTAESCRKIGEKSQFLFGFVVPHAPIAQAQ